MHEWQGWKTRISQVKPGTSQRDLNSGVPEIITDSWVFLPTDTPGCCEIKVVFLFDLCEMQWRGSKQSVIRCVVGFGGTPGTSGDQRGVEEGC